MMALRMAGISPPVERSITVSAPYLTEYCNFSSSSLMFEVVDGIADVRVDLAFGRDAYAHRLERPMIDIGWNNHPAAGNFGANPAREQYSRVAPRTPFRR